MNMSTYMNHEMFRELGGFNKEIHFGDYDFFARALMIEPFARVNQILSCFRRHGDNYSMQVTPLLKYFAEADAVASQFGPSQKWKRLCYRYLLKSWLNARNPSWFMHKCFDKRISGFKDLATGEIFMDELSIKDDVFTEGNYVSLISH